MGHKQTNRHYENNGHLAVDQLSELFFAVLLYDNCWSLTKFKFPRNVFVEVFICRVIVCIGSAGRCRGCSVNCLPTSI